MGWKVIQLGNGALNLAEDDKGGHNLPTDAIRQYLIDHPCMEVVHTPEFRPLCVEMFLACDPDLIATFRRALEPDADEWSKIEYAIEQAKALWETALEIEIDDMVETRPR